MSKAELREIWKARIADYQASGQRTSDWCAAHQVTPRQLAYWKKVFKDKPDETVAPKSQWLSVNVDHQLAETESSLLVKVGSVAIEVRPGYNPSLLSDVVRTLKTLC